MRCPFVDRDCVERDCPGWSHGKCFVEILSLKLDTLTNLVSRLTTEFPTKPGPLGIDAAEATKEGTIDQDAAIIETGIRQKGPPRVWEAISTPLSVGEAILAMDFGTAFSKIAVRRHFKEIAHPVPIADVAARVLYEAKLIDEVDAGGNEFVEDSIVYIDDESEVFCGTLARRRFVDASNSGSTRPGIQNLKQLMIGGGSNLPLRTDYFPSSERLSTQEILATYLAYLFRLAKTYLLNVQETYSVNIDETFRNFSMPVWENQHYRENVQDMMRGAISKAYCLERWLQDQLITGVPLPQLRDALKEAEKYEHDIEKAIIGTDVTEPVAAGYSHILNLDVEPGRPYHIFVVDAGAGSTDFAFFTISQPIERKRGLTIHIGHKQGSVGKGVDVWDKALRALLHAQVSERSGLRPEDHSFQIFSTNLDANLRRYKEIILASTEGYEIDLSPASESTVRINRGELEDSPAVRDALSSIREGFAQYIREITQIIAKDHFDASRTEILVTGGGSFMPSIVNCVRECASTLGSSFSRRVQNDYVPAIYEEIPNIGNVYPMLAVSLGSTEKEYLRERRLSRITGTPPPVTLEGYYTKGI